MKKNKVIETTKIKTGEQSKLLTKPKEKIKLTTNDKSIEKKQMKMKTDIDTNLLLDFLESYNQENKLECLRILNESKIKFIYQIKNNF